MAQRRLLNTEYTSRPKVHHFLAIRNQPFFFSLSHYLSPRWFCSRLLYALMCTELLYLILRACDIHLFAQDHWHQVSRSSDHKYYFFKRWKVIAFCERRRETNTMIEHITRRESILWFSFARFAASSFMHHLEYILNWIWEDNMHTQYACSRLHSLEY